MKSEEGSWSSKDFPTERPASYLGPIKIPEKDLTCFVDVHTNCHRKRTTNEDETKYLHMCIYICIYMYIHMCIFFVFTYMFG